MRRGNRIYQRVFNSMRPNEPISCARPLVVIRGAATAVPSGPSDLAIQLSGSRFAAQGQAGGWWRSRIGPCARLICLMLFGLLGCTIPKAGPTTPQVLHQAESEGRGHFDIVSIDSRIVKILRAEPAPSLRSEFAKDGKPPPLTIGIGDTVSVTIFEAAAGGSPGAAAPAAGPAPTVFSTTIPDQVVASDGAITLPYVGRVSVAGHTRLEVQRDIDQRLSAHLTVPEAIVTVTKSVSNTVTVSGEVVGGARVSLPEGGERLLDVIAAAGGAKAPLYDTFVRLSRGGVTATIPMATLVAHPEENIYAWPGDVITVVQAPQTFSVFGATGNNSLVPFSASQINLAQAIAKSGGLQDSRADPAGVFLFRFEPRPIVKDIGVPILFTTHDGASPVLYHIDLSKIGNYFLAEGFPMKNDDLIYVANASMTDLQKFFSLVGTISGPVIGGAFLTQSTGK
jgi:polysaccharide biosynthesis/export protein